MKSNPDKNASVIRMENNCYSGKATTSPYSFLMIATNDESGFQPPSLCVQRTHEKLSSQSKLVLTFFACLRIFVH